MIRIESVLTFIIFSKLNNFSIDNVQQICQAKFDLAGHMLNFAGKSPVTGHYLYIHTGFSGQVTNCWQLTNPQP